MDASEEREIVRMKCIWTCKRCFKIVQKCHHCVVCKKDAFNSECKNCFAPICSECVRNMKECMKCLSNPHLMVVLKASARRVADDVTCTTGLLAERARGKKSSVIF